MSLSRATPPLLPVQFPDDDAIGPRTTACFGTARGAGLDLGEATLACAGVRLARTGLRWNGWSLDGTVLVGGGRYGIEALAEHTMVARRLTRASARDTSTQYAIPCLPRRRDAGTPARCEARS